MPFDTVGAGQSYGLVIALLIALAVLLLRNRRPRRLRVELLWIRPVLFLGLLVTMAFVSPPPLTSMTIGLAIVALGLGGALGWQRGRFMRIEVDPETHALASRASPVGLVFILALLAIRLGLRGVLNENATKLHIPALAITDALVAFAAGMMTVQGVEMWLRARRLLAEALMVKTDAAASEARSVDSAGAPASKFDGDPNRFMPPSPAAPTLPAPAPPPPAAGAAFPTRP